MPTTATTHLRSFCWVVFSHIYVKQFYCSFWSKAICMYSFSIKLIYRKFSKLCLPATFIKWFCFDMLAFFGGKSPKANKHIFLNHTANTFYIQNIGQEKNSYIAKYKLCRLYIKQCTVEKFKFSEFLLDDKNATYLSS